MAQYNNIGGKYEQVKNAVTLPLAASEMIKVARAQEEEARLGIDYHVADGAEMPDLDRFDLVTAVYLLNYAESPDHMRRMVERIFASLVDGGRAGPVRRQPGGLARRGFRSRHRGHHAVPLPRCDLRRGRWLPAGCAPQHTRRPLSGARAGE